MSRALTRHLSSTDVFAVLLPPETGVCYAALEQGAPGQAQVEKFVQEFKARFNGIDVPHCSFFGALLGRLETVEQWENYVALPTYVGPALSLTQRLIQDFEAQEDHAKCPRCPKAQLVGLRILASQIAVKVEGRRKGIAHTTLNHWKAKFDPPTLQEMRLAEVLSTFKAMKKPQVSLEPLPRSEVNSQSFLGFLRDAFCDCSEGNVDRLKRVFEWTKDAAGEPKLLARCPYCEETASRLIVQTGPPVKLQSLAKHLRLHLKKKDRAAVSRHYQIKSNPCHPDDVPVDERQDSLNNPGRITHYFLPSSSTLENADARENPLPHSGSNAQPVDVEEFQNSLPAPTPENGARENPLPQSPSSAEPSSAENLDYSWRTYFT